MARNMSGGTGVGGRVVTGMVSFVIFFAVLQILAGLSGWNASATYAVLIKTTVPIFIALYILVGNKLENALSRG